LPRSCPSKPLAGQLVGELQLLLLQRDNLYSAWITDLQDGAVIAVVLTRFWSWRLCGALLISVIRPWRAFKRGQSFRNEDVVKMGKLVASVPLAVVIFVTPIIYWFINTSSSTFENAFLHYRDLYLASGVAPALPGLMLVAIAYLGILAYLRRISCWEYGSVKTPALPLDDTFPTDFTPNVECIDAWMLGNPSRIEEVCRVVSFSFLGSLLALRPWATMDTLEGKWVYRFLVAGFIFSFFILSVNWIRFLAMLASIESYSSWP